MINYVKNGIDVEVDDEILEAREDSLFSALAAKGAFKTAELREV